MALVHTPQAQSIDDPSFGGTYPQSSSVPSWGNYGTSAYAPASLSITSYTANTVEQSAYSPAVLSCPREQFSYQDKSAYEIAAALIPYSGTPYPDYGGSYSQAVSPYYGQQSPSQALTYSGGYAPSRAIVPYSGPQYSNALVSYGGATQSSSALVPYLGQGSSALVPYSGSADSLAVSPYVGTQATFFTNKTPSAPVKAPAYEHYYDSAPPPNFTYWASNVGGNVASVMHSRPNYTNHYYYQKWSMTTGENSGLRIRPYGTGSIWKPWNVKRQNFFY